MLADSATSFNPLSTVLGAVWQMVCGILGMVHLRPHQVAYIVLVILGVQVLLHVRRAFTGKSSWSLDDPDRTSDPGRS